MCLYIHIGGCLHILAPACSVFTVCCDNVPYAGIGASDAGGAIPGQSHVTSLLCPEESGLISFYLIQLFIYLQIVFHGVTSIQKNLHCL